MYDFCSTVTGVLSLGIIILGIIGMRNSQKAKDANKKDISSKYNINADDGEEAEEDHEV
ncbi:MAG: hypothetical protein J1E64_09415 [Acetatifactor sp.]|nr:hypothetical protein [Acetatifactor sp.]